MRSWLIACIVVVLVSALDARAQTQPNPVLEHYRAYRAAFDAGDLQRAAREAEQALAASEAADGADGATPVLTYNLGMVRLLAGDAPGAIDPAERAFAFAEAGANVDAVMAGLILGRAELEVRGRPGAERLRALLNAPVVASASELYPAAAALGAWAVLERDHELAEEAWAHAAANADGAPTGGAYARGHALTWQAASIILGAIGRRGAGRIDDDRADEANRLLTEAMSVLCPLAVADAASLEFTPAQRAAAEALAWRSALRAKLRSDGQTIAEAEGDAAGEIVELPTPVDLISPRCRVRLDAEPSASFPWALRNNSGAIAGLTLRLRVNEAGEVVENEIVARVGDPAFARSVEAVAGRWRVVRTAAASPGCRMQTTWLVPVAFARTSY